MLLNERCLFSNCKGENKESNLKGVRLKTANELCK